MTDMHLFKQHAHRKFKLLLLYIKHSNTRQRTVLKHGKFTSQSLTFCWFWRRTRAPRPVERSLSPRDT